MKVIIFEAKINIFIIKSKYKALNFMKIITFRAEIVTLYSLKVTKKRFIS